MDEIAEKIQVLEEKIAVLTNDISNISENINRLYADIDSAFSRINDIDAKMTSNLLELKKCLIDLLRTIDKKIDKTNQLMNLKIQQLEEEVDRHTAFISRLCGALRLAAFALGSGFVLTLIVIFLKLY